MCCHQQIIRRNKVPNGSLRGGTVTPSVCKKIGSQNGGHVSVKTTKLNSSMEKTISALPLNGLAFTDKLNPRKGTVKTQLAQTPLTIIGNVPLCPHMLPQSALSTRPAQILHLNCSLSTRHSSQGVKIKGYLRKMKKVTEIQWNNFCSFQDLCA